MTRIAWVGPIRALTPTGSPFAVWPRDMKDWSAEVSQQAVYLSKGNVVMELPRSFCQITYAA